MTIISEDDGIEWIKSDSGPVSKTETQRIAELIDPVGFYRTGDFTWDDRRSRRQKALQTARNVVAVMRSRPDGAPRTFALGDRVEKVSGSSWRGTVVGFYSTTLTPEGYAVESENEPGSVQIYPVKALRALAAAPQAGVADGSVMVPREPTEAMVLAAFNEIDWARSEQFQRHPDDKELRDGSGDEVGTTPAQDIKDAWAAMISASPPRLNVDVMQGEVLCSFNPNIAAAPEPPERFASQEVERLREALEPFAKACTISTYADADVIDDTLAANKITWGHLRRALSALAELPQPDAKEGGDA